MTSQHAAPALIQARGATKRFGSFTAVDGVDLSVTPGEIVGLLGANGAGKTTLIRMILGLASVDGGSVDLFGHPPTRSARARLGYVPQGLGLYTDLSVAENVDFVAGAYHIAPPPLPERLRPLAQRQVADIGLGLQRQLAFHCALLHRPELLVLDEPTSGVDPLARARLWDTVNDQASAGIGVLVTTHYMQEAEQCTRLLLMSRGRVVASGRAEQIVGQAQVAQIHSLDWARAFTVCRRADLPVTLAGRDIRIPGAEAEPIQHLLADAGIRAQVSMVAATLEEVMVVAERAAS